MILVTGGTGFVGQALVRQLAADGRDVRLLIRPSSQTPKLPRGIPVEVAVTSLTDERGIRAALRGVETVYHLAGAEHLGAKANLRETDIRGTETLAKAAAETRVRRFFYVSHLGADRSSYYALLKAKGLAEDAIRRSGVPYTILRASILYGAQDHFSAPLAMLAAAFPALPLPRNGDVLIQPLWVEDLVTCLQWSLSLPETVNQVYDIGGAEYFPYRHALETIMDVSGNRRFLFSLNLPTLKNLTITLESLLPGYPFSSFWVDYLSYNRTCSVDSIPRLFGFLPARFTYRLEHLRGINWKALARQTLFQRPQKK